MKIKTEEAASLSLGILIILFWHFSYRVSCLSLIFPILAGLLIFNGVYEFKIKKRECTAECYFEKRAFLYKIFTRKGIIFIHSTISAAILATALSLFLTDLDKESCAVLLIGIPLSIFLYDFLLKRGSLKKHVAKNASSTINALILTLTLLTLSLYRTPPEYVNESLAKTIELSVKKPLSKCETIDAVLVCLKYAKAVKWWMILKFSLIDLKYFIKLIVWILFLIGNYMALLAFGKYILEIKTLTEKFTDEKR